VYTDFVITLVKSTQRLDILSPAGLGKRTDSFVNNLPSWVVDLSDPRPSVYGNATLPGLDASEDLEADCSFSDDSTCLYTRNAIPDTIVWSSHFPEFTENFSFEAFLEDLCGPSRGNYSHPTYLPRLQIFFRTLIKDVSGYGYGKVSFADDAEEAPFLKMAAQFLFNITLQRPDILDDAGTRDFQAELMNKLTLFEEFSGSEGLEQRLPRDFQFAYEHGDASMNFNARWYENVQDMSIFVMEKGYMGIGLDEVVAGDNICVLPGCSVPLVVRMV
jgi:hypothetical protein